MEQVSAWKAKDGSVHESKLEAAKVDARLVLKSVGIEKEETQNFLIRKADQIVDALEPVYTEMMSQPRTAIAVKESK